MNLPIIEVNRRKMFMQFSEIFYDVHIQDKEAFDCNYAQMFATESGIRKLFKDGYSPSLLSLEQMSRVERMNINGQPFLIIVVDNDDVVATVHHHDVEY
jgi:hypothetical protein